MHILRIANVPDNRTGGMSRAMHFTGDEMRRCGHEVSYLFRAELAPRDASKLERFTVPLRVPRLVSELARSGRRFDVVEIHEPLAAAYCVARRWNKALPPLVVFSHGLEERGYAAEMAYLRLKSRPITLKFRLSPRTQIAQAEYAVRHADHVLCCSEEDRRYLLERGVPTERLTRHQNGVSNAFLEASDVAPVHRGGVLFMGSWLLRKGTLETVAAITSLLRKHATATFTAAGTGVPAEAVLAEFDTDVRPRVTVLPSITSDDDLVELYRGHRILLLPSFFEGQPLVMIEAAAARMAIVTTDVCGMRDFIEDGRNGRLVRVGDAVATRRALDDLWYDSTLTQRLGEAARKTAEQHTWAHAAARMIRAYEGALEGSGARLPAQDRN